MTTTGKETPVELIKRELAGCIAEAKAHASDESEIDADSCEFSGDDCDWVVDTFRKSFGRMPTKEEWADAGLKYIGGAHYAAALE